MTDPGPLFEVVVAHHGCSDLVRLRPDVVPMIAQEGQAGARLAHHLRVMSRRQNGASNHDGVSVACLEA